MQKIFVVGDIHGCFDKLCALMDKIPINNTRDQLIFIGDYIDRGPSSFDVVNYLIDFKKRVPGTIFIKGNHEDMLQNYLDGSDRFTYLLNGGQQTMDEYLNRSDNKEPFPIPSEHLEFFNSLQLYYQTDDYIFVHAGLREKVPLESQDKMDLLWTRDEFIHSDFNFGKRVIFGHTPFKEPLLQANKIGIDTGAVYGNLLTCLQLPEMEFFSA
ncbi:MAG: serine/threonine protein phosphatase [Desulfobacterales bacterium]|jgi:serine/threonine protein phosphatase 1|nr:serine/threonine protein phosphatase [Desulfobacterales bacterium]MCK5204151.1 serine/threonine protein phosphatase [Desulfobacterales bacterium]MCK5485289.1 serine/threonine protein phosphatase [Desulfobacterales bacterium]